MPGIGIINRGASILRASVGGLLANISESLNYYFAEHAENPLTIPTPLDDNELTHPDVIDFGGTWNGYKYWMAYTPLPEVDPDPNENPCIVASNDKITWVVPAGGSNPITPTPPVSYNADTTLFFENGTLYCFYRTWVTDPLARLIIGYKSTTDGITWSAQGELPFSGINTVQLDVGSPSFVKFGGKYYIYSLSIDQIPVIPANAKFIRLESDSLLGTYSNPTDIILDESKSIMGDVDPTLQYPWHANFKKIGSGVVGIIYYRASSVIRYQLETVFMTSSSDSLNFKLAQSSLFTRQWTGQGFWDTSQYRVAFTPRIVNNEYVFDLWYPGWVGDHEIFPTRIGLTEINKVSCGLDIGDTNVINDTRTDELTEAVALNTPYTFGDDVSGADGSINPSACGLNYTIGSGAFQRLDNEIRNANESSSAYFTLTVPLDYELTFQGIKGTGVATTDGGFTIWPKAKGTSKWISIQDAPFASEILKVQDVGAHEINEFYVPYRRSLVNEYKIRFVGDNFKYYCNGRLLIDHTFTAADADSQAGLDDILSQTTFLISFAANINARIKNLTIKDLT